MLPFFHFSLFKKNARLQCFSLLFPFLCFNVSASSLPVVDKTLAFSYEELSLPADEGMGLLGGNYLFSIYDNWYTGLGVYGAVEGKRGGFFTGGLALGWRHSFYQRFFVDLNGFVGGGGGGAAPQGGGLMLRTSIELGVDYRQSSFGLGYSSVEFPNGNISSQQFSLNYRYSFSVFHFSGWPQDKAQNMQWLKKLMRQSRLSDSQFSLQFTRYFPRDSVAVSGRQFDSQLDILGVRWRNHLKHNYWLEFETGGAMLGNIDGFAQVFSGLSYDYTITSRVYGSSGLLVGAAGGGDVNTNGGVVYRAFGGVGYRFNTKWSIKSELAWTAALEGNFKAVTALLNIVYHYQQFKPYNRKLVDKSREVTSQVSWRRYRIRPGLQRYSHYRGTGRKSPTQKNIDVNLINLKLDSFITSKFYVTGQAIGAFSGKAGGYAVGLVGPGYQISRYLSAELLIGAAGGGGLAVGSGQIAQPMVNIHLPLNECWALEASLGYIRAVNGDLSAIASNVALSYRFRAPLL